MSGRHSRYYRQVGIIIILACLYFCILGVKQASAFTVETDIAKLVEKLNTEVHLERFSEYTTADKEAVERGLADTEFLNKEWAGRSLSDFLSHYGITLPGEAVTDISSFENGIETGVQALPAGGETAFLAGGEGLDAAATGIGVAGIGAAVGTVAAAAGAFAAGYYIGENLVEVFGDKTKSEEGIGTETTASLGEPVLNEVWQRAYVCSHHCYESMGELFFEGDSRDTIHFNGEEFRVSSGPTYGTGGFSEHAPIPAEFDNIGDTFYVLTPQIETISCGTCFTFDAVGFIPEHDEGKAWPYGNPQSEEEEEGCENWYNPADQVEGWPPNLRKTHLSVGNGPYENVCVPWEEVGCPFHCERKYKHQKEVTAESVMVWRAPRDMSVNFPKPSRHECHEGFTCEHTEVPAYPPLETLLEKLPQAFSHEKHENLNETIDHFLGSPVPLPGEVAIPACGIAETASFCKSHIEGYGFTNVEIDPVTWEHAVLTRPSNAVIGTNPSTGSVVSTESLIEVLTNPATMPIVIPTPGHETATQYKERLETLGEHDISISTRAENDTNPGVGPEEVAGVVPNPGRPTNPDGSTPVRVEENPPSASAPPEETHGIGGPTLPGFNIPEFKVECKGFPFGVPCWLAETVESWSASAVAPEWGIDNFTIEGHSITGAKFNLSHLEPIMEKIRPAMLIFATIGLVLLFYRFARGGTPPSGSGTGDDTAPEDQG